jgi:hypothetical protein
MAAVPRPIHFNWEIIIAERTPWARAVAGQEMGLGESAAAPPSVATPTNRPAPSSVERTSEAGIVQLREGARKSGRESARQAEASSPRRVNRDSRIARPLAMRLRTVPTGQPNSAAACSCVRPSR